MHLRPCPKCRTKEGIVIADDFVGMRTYWYSYYMCETCGYYPATIEDYPGGGWVYAVSDEMIWNAQSEEEKAELRKYAEEKNTQYWKNVREEQEKKAEKSRRIREAQKLRPESEWILKWNSSGYYTPAEPKEDLELPVISSLLVCKECPQYEEFLKSQH